MYIAELLCLCPFQVLQILVKLYTSCSSIITFIPYKVTTYARHLETYEYSYGRSGSAHSPWAKEPSFLPRARGRDCGWSKHWTFTIAPATHGSSMFISKQRCVDNGTVRLQMQINRIFWIRGLTADLWRRRRHSGITSAGRCLYAHI